MYVCVFYECCKFVGNKYTTTTIILLMTAMLHCCLVTWIAIFLIAVISVMCVINLTNLIKDPTCFKGDTLTLVDMFLTNKPKSFSEVINTDIGSSDFHNYIGVASRVHAPISVKRKIYYRSMKNFSENSFPSDMTQVPFHVCNNWWYLLDSKSVTYVCLKWTRSSQIKAYKQTTGAVHEFWAT